MKQKEDWIVLLFEISICVPPPFSLLLPVVVWGTVRDLVSQSELILRLLNPCAFLISQNGFQNGDRYTSCCKCADVHVSWGSDWLHFLHRFSWPGMTGLFDSSTSSLSEISRPSFLDTMCLQWTLSNQRNWVGLEYLFFQRLFDDIHAQYNSTSSRELSMIFFGPTIVQIFMLENVSFANTYTCLASTVSGESSVARNFLLNVFAQVNDTVWPDGRSSMPLCCIVPAFKSKPALIIRRHHSANWFSFSSFGLRPMVDTA